MMVGPLFEARGEWRKPLLLLDYDHISKNIYRQYTFSVPKTKMTVGSNVLEA